MTNNSSISFIGGIPKIYDEILGPAYFEPYAIETARRVSVLNPKSVLEIACGTGRVTNHLSKSIPEEATLIATDISHDMLDVAKNKLVLANNILWQEADALNLPFKDYTFDVVVCQFGVMFFSDKAKGFTEAFRVLKKGGTFIFSVWDSLESNPVAGAGRKILKDYFEGNPPKQIGTAFSMSDKEKISTLLATSGFVNYRFETVTKICIAESAEDLATATVDGSLISQFIREKNVKAIPVLRKKVYEAIKNKFGDHPVRGSMQAIIITAEKVK